MPFVSLEFSQYCILRSDWNLADLQGLLQENCHWYLEKSSSG